MAASEHLSPQQFAHNASDDPGRWDWNQKQWDTKRPEITASKSVGAYTLHHEPIPDDPGFHMIHATTTDGHYVGKIFFGPHNTTSTSQTEGAPEVDPKYRRKGIGTAMYDYAQEITGKPMAPAYSHSDYAEAFWKARTDL